MTLDPITLYAGKVAAAWTVGSLATAWSIVGATDTAQTVIAGGFGLTVIAAGVFKLLSDHTVATNARKSADSREAALVADNARLEYVATRERELRHLIELEAIRAGLALPSLRDLPLDPALDAYVRRGAAALELGNLHDDEAPD